ncbi:hypothetical protein PVK06_043640 [Gossypium arboreum]|uniref:Uncharacterized protein n=1 Tax=Gossypium arboreum TaxID=29729 RepID=A0ABR0MP18_GOSAR|nr:hypothetical protein PVK06_043640 [Gossypium arboreum]
MPSCKTTKPSNSERLSNMLHMMEQMRKMLKEIFEVLPPREEVVHDVPNLDLEDPRIIVDHLKLGNSSQKVFGTRDHGDKLNMDEAFSGPIDIESDIIVNVATNVKVKVITWSLNRL